jgi:hypothetical protein
MQTHRTSLVPNPTLTTLVLVNASSGSLTTPQQLLQIDFSPHSAGRPQPHTPPVLAVSLH